MVFLFKRKYNKLLSKYSCQLCRVHCWKWTNNLRCALSFLTDRLRIRCFISLQTNVDSTGGGIKTVLQNCFANLLSSSCDPSNIVRAELWLVSIWWITNRGGSFQWSDEIDEKNAQHRTILRCVLCQWLTHVWMTIKAILLSVSMVMTRCKLIQRNINRI